MLERLGDRNMTDPEAFESIAALLYNAAPAIQQVCCITAAWLDAKPLAGSQIGLCCRGLRQTAAGVRRQALASRIISMFSKDEVMCAKKQLLMAVLVSLPVGALAGSVKSLTAEQDVKGADGVVYTESYVDCASSSELRAIRRPLAGGKWCGKDAPGYCSSRKITAAKKVCGRSYSEALDDVPQSGQRVSATSAIAGVATAEKAGQEAEKKAPVTAGAVESPVKAPAEEPAAAEKTAPAVAEKSAVADDRTDAANQRELEIEKERLKIEQERLELRRQRVELQKQELELQRALEAQEKARQAEAAANKEAASGEEKRSGVHKNVLGM